ncbi:hypothetical protein GCM10022224_005560 [Nonomuraea antimicrobica]|uniref:RNA polymerase sigma-70 factor, ECF subfamily n=1 Tax=Nonomuraea antimicrobica TaxID=561173 RepID=A0ABP7B113_9ACTN
MPWPCTSPPPGATYKGIAADLGVSRGGLRAWVLRARARVLQVLHNGARTNPCVWQ